jgi:hypothetical protein
LRTLTNKEPMPYLTSRTSNLPRLLLLSLVAFAISACTPQSRKEGTDSEATSRASVLLTRDFLKYSATGDSISLARIADDTVVTTILLNHRLGSTEHLLAAAESFRSPTIHIYPSGSDVNFRYELAGQVLTAFVSLDWRGPELIVYNYGIPAIID